ncbi:MAG: adenylate cyclase [Variovorax paradoxus]|jgi:RNA polymerase subunit RPABC4/transcription elongation factor Spt4|uniref:Adenylate cyclase n=1 Tax=Variovorax paradoxus TaxID=34073 RepID=A0A2W5SF56_VARPD|nr:MAG: adenylate cyclase [Variovorax paradoxus]
MGIFERFLGGGHHRGGGGHHGRKGYQDSGHGYGYGGPPPRDAGVACPNCRAINGPQARFCQACGASTVPAACTQCGTAMQPGAKFCGQCGKAAGQ